MDVDITWIQRVCGDHAAAYTDVVLINVMGTEPNVHCVNVNVNVCVCVQWPQTSLNALQRGGRNGTYVGHQQTPTLPPASKPRLTRAKGRNGGPPHGNQIHERRNYTYQNRKFLQTRYGTPTDQYVPHAAVACQCLKSGSCTAVLLHTAAAAVAAAAVVSLLLHSKRAKVWKVSFVPMS